MIEIVISRSNKHIDKICGLVKKDIDCFEVGDLLYFELDDRGCYYLKNNQIHLYVLDNFDCRLKLIEMQRRI